MEDGNETVLALLPISLIGSVLNWAIFLAVHNLKTFNHAFGYLSANQSLADALHSTTFLLYFCPMLLLDQSTMKAMSRHCGFFILFCYELSLMIHLVISLNRFCAVFSPYRYSTLFSQTNTKIIIAATWLCTGTVAFFFYEEYCQFYYEEGIHSFTFTNSEVCGYIAWYGDFLKNVSIVAIIGFIDILTVLKVRKMSRKIVGNISNQAQNRLSNREIRFLKQTVTQGSVFMLELLTYFFIPQYFENKWIVFFGTTFAWVAVSAVDGMVVVLFNPEVRKFLYCKKEKHVIVLTTTNQASNP